MYRDFTYIDDAVDALYKIIIKKPVFKKKYMKNLEINVSNCNFHLLNIGNNKKTKLSDFVKILEKTLKKKAIIKYEKIQMGDVRSTVTSNKILKNFINMRKPTSHEVGISKFVEWYKNYFLEHKKIKYK